MTAPHLDPTRKHDYVFMVDVRDGNPNGDPDAGGMPRLDPVTSQGLITDVAIKRKVRNVIPLLNEGRAGYDIYVEAGVALNAQHERAYTALGDTTTPVDAQKWMCETFYDIRMFGAVMTTGTKHAGRVQGPMQLTFARSVDEVLPLDIGITRVTQTRQADIDKGESTEMGSKHIVPYGLYVGEGHFSAPLAARTGVTTDDLEAFWRAFTLMLDHDRASTRGSMSLRGLYVFTHDDAYGRAPARQLLDRVHVQPVGTGPARGFDDYKIEILDGDLPAGITLTRILG
ncbi:type I-C CRISPR-associated protein Cas7/Csd2 [Embleya sp. NPDC020630]|uniref:type I-C CRISPR-associated protein Cas7/Csd2 n=1 Tax=Embleya sp. NPDC020630 TaxID=3363979 RepID=UPI00379390C9